LRKLASIQRIEALTPIEGKDRIELADILGWQAIVKKGEFEVGGLCLFFEIDSILPDRPEFEFLRDKKFRIKTMRMGGVLSQGLAWPIDILTPDQIVQVYEDSRRVQEWRALETFGTDVHFSPTHLDTLAAHAATALEASSRLTWLVGEDVTEILGVKKYDPYVRTPGAPGSRGAPPSGYAPFPYSIPKTDEVRIQSAPALLAEMEGRPWVATVKLDGSSATYWHDGNRLRVCSRNYEIKEPDEGIYWRIARELDLEHKLSFCPLYAFQGEIVGPGVQGNPLGLDELQFRVFNIYDTGESGRLYMNHDTVEYLCRGHGLQMVPFAVSGETFGCSIKELLAMSEGTYPNGRQREGIVIRPIYEAKSRINGRLSFKVISNSCLLKAA